MDSHRMEEHSCKAWWPDQEALRLAGHAPPGAACLAAIYGVVKPTLAVHDARPAHNEIPIVLM